MVAHKKIRRYAKKIVRYRSVQGYGNWHVWDAKQERVIAVTTRKSDADRISRSLNNP